MRDERDERRDERAEMGEKMLPGWVKGGQNLAEYVRLLLLFDHLHVLRNVALERQRAAHTHIAVDATAILALRLSLYFFLSLPLSNV